MANTIRTIQNDRLDQLAKRVFGSEKGGIVEKILAINPHLPEQPAILPANVLIVLPEPPAPKKVKQTVKLWN